MAGDSWVARGCGLAAAIKSAQAGAAMHIHVVGVSGTGMGALAGLLKEQGHRVTGSDLAFEPPMGPALREWGIECVQGYDAEHLAPAPDLVVVGNVCRPDNPEVRAAFDRGLEVVHIAEALQRFALVGTRPLVIAGTHGKTTTAAMAAWALDGAGRAPGYLIGGLPANFPRSFRSARTHGGASGEPPFVIEGDEYDTAFFEKTAKFLHYHPQVAVITSIEHDHVDIYADFDAYRAAFRGFIRSVPASGLIVAHAGDPVVVELVREAAQAETIWYALEGRALSGAPPHWTVAPVGSDSQGTAFDLFVGGVSAGRARLLVPGCHNVLNAAAAMAAAVHGFGATVAQVVRSVATFQGVKRRQELLGEPGGVAVYDDFAHHPTAVRETLQALRARHPSGRLWAVFEPRSATACRRLHQESYASAFGAADQVVLAPLGRANLAREEALDLERLVEAMRATGQRVELAGGIDPIVERLALEAEPGDVVALLSNGAFGGIHGKVLERLRARIPE